MKSTKWSSIAIFILGLSSVSAQNQPGTLDPTFNTNGDGSFGPGGVVNIIEIQPDGKVLMGGPFSQYDGLDRKRIARANTDGSLDLTFEVGLGFGPGGGLESQVRDIKYFGDKIYVLGDFTTYQEIINAPHIIRLNEDGTHDDSFNPGAGLENGGSYRTMGIQSSGKVLVGGQFGDYNNLDLQISNLYRINSDGTFDASFVPAPEISNDVSEVTRIVVLDNDKILVAFNADDGASHIILLDIDGEMISEFAAADFDDEILSIAVQPDGKILLGGSFTSVGAQSSHGMTRLVADGSVDEGFDIGFGFNSSVRSLILQPDGKIIAAGAFTFFDDQPQPHIVRLNANGTKDFDFFTGTGFSAPVNSLAFDEDYQIYCGGEFQTTQAINYRRAVRLSNSILYITDISPGWPFCQGNNLEVSFTAIGNFDENNNEFWLHLGVDVDDSFIVTIEPGSASGSMTFQIPLSTQTSVTFWVSATQPMIETNGFNSVYLDVLPTLENWAQILFDDAGLCLGSELTFLAEADNPGLNPVFQWTVNGTPAGNSDFFTSNQLVNGDEVVLTLTTSELCTFPFTIQTPPLVIDLPVSQSQVTVNVLDSNGPVTDMAVEWYNTAPAFGEIAYFRTDSLATDNSGAVIFNNVPPGVYKVRALPDYNIPNQQTLITTWFPQKFGWVWGQEILIGCDTDWNETIPMIEANVDGSIDVIIGGVVNSGTGRSFAGDPIPGIPIVIQSDTTSLANNPFVMNFTGELGLYNFSQLPPGDYQVYLDMPGLPILETYFFNILEGETTFINLDFCVDSLQGIFKAVNCIAESINEFPSQHLIGYPNPFEQIVDIILPSNSDVTPWKRNFFRSDGTTIQPVSVTGSQRALRVDFGNTPKGLILYTIWNDKESFSGKLMKE